MDAWAGMGYQRAALFIRKLRGGSQPILVAGTNGLLYVLKFADNLQGRNLPFNEVVGTELFRACGLPVAEWEPLLLTDEFLDENPGCWIETETGFYRPKAGLCFASRYLGSAGRQLLEILPGAYFSRVRNRKSFWLAWLLDVCCGHTDNRQAIFCKDQDGWLQAFFIDSGHLLGGAKGNQKSNLWSSRYLDPRIYERINSGDAGIYMRAIESLNVDKLRSFASRLPQDWQSQAGMTALTMSLERLTDRGFVKATFEMLLDTAARRTGTERDVIRVEDIGSWNPLLHSGIPSEPDRERDRAFAGYCLNSCA